MKELDVLVVHANERNSKLCPCGSGKRVALCPWQVQTEPLGFCWECTESIRARSVRGIGSEGVNAFGRNSTQRSATITKPRFPSIGTIVLSRFLGIWMCENVLHGQVSCFHWPYTATSYTANYTANYTVTAAIQPIQRTLIVTAPLYMYTAYTARFSLYKYTVYSLYSIQRYTPPLCVSRARVHCAVTTG